MKNENKVTLYQAYRKLEEQFSNYKTNELIQVSSKINFRNSEDMKTEGIEFFNSIQNDILISRKELELNYHNYLLSGLIHRTIELDFMTDLNIFESRRLVFTNPDCISLIQLIIRDKIYLSVNFRSSHFANALPADLEFLTSIPSKFIDYMTSYYEKSGVEKYINSIEELNNKEVQLLLIFGSLHIDKKD